MQGDPGTSDLRRFLLYHVRKTCTWCVCVCVCGACVCVCVQSPRPGSALIVVPTPGSDPVTSGLNASFIRLCETQGATTPPTRNATRDVSNLIESDQQVAFCAA